MRLVKNLCSSKNFFSLNISNTADAYHLIAENRSDEDAANVRVRVDGHATEDGVVLKKHCETRIDSMESGETATVEKLEPAHIHHMTDYIVTAVVKDSWIHHKFQNRKLKNVTPYEKESGDRGWIIPCIKKRSVPVEELLYVLCKDEYLMESNYKKSQFAKMVKKNPFTKPALVELYELVDYYHFGDGKTDKRKQEMVALLRDVHGVELQKTERNQIMMSQCLAGMDYFKMTSNQMAVTYMKLNP